MKPKHLRGKGRQPAKSTRSKSAPSVKPSAPKKSVLERILEFARVEEKPSARAGYNAILGIAGPVVDLSFANQAQMSAIQRTVQKSLLRHFAEKGMEWGIQTTRFGVVPASSAEIDVPETRKASRLYAQAGVDAIMVVMPTPAPLNSDPCGIGLALDARALVFGSNARSMIQRAEMKSRGRRGNSPARTPIQWHEGSDKAALKAELANMFRPSLIKMATADGADGLLPHDEWDTRHSRQLRGLLTLMTRSMLPLKKSLTLIGEGRSMMAGAIAAAEVNMKKARRGSELPVHPDGVPHFWFGELRRLGLNEITVPLVKLR